MIVCSISELCLCVNCNHHYILLQIRLGNLDSKRDWGHARDYVEVRLGYIYIYIYAALMFLKVFMLNYACIYLFEIMIHVHTFVG